ncbi:PepSY domain-containing protein [Vibrio mytili]|uniref:PepSY-associated TM helix domain-containing protein n=1 Tax=Vibrio mytili TaxID=50718 RepID=UPI002F41FC40
MSIINTPQPTLTARRKTLYFLTWRWHFYAGLFVVPFMLMLALTGLVMLFDDEIEIARYSDVLKVTPQTQVMPVSDQLAAVQKSFPDGQITQFIPAAQSDLANRFSVLFGDGSTRFVTVNPYSAEVLGTFDRSDSWYELANSIHGTLLIGDWGDYLIEVAASLGMILLVSGVYLWLPLDNARKAGFLKVRVSNGARIFWRDLHANLGGMLSLVLLFFLISGLAWAGLWGGKLVQAWNTFPTYYTWGEKPISVQTHADLNHGSEKEMPWNLEQTPVPQSHHHGGAQDVVSTNATFGIDQVIAQAKDLGFTQYRVAFPRGESGVYTVSANTMAGDIVDPRDDRTAHFDQYSGALLAEVTWQDYSLFAKAMAAGTSLHQGDLSIWNKISNVLFCLAFILISMTGVVMWWLRRPKGQARLGVPPRFERDGIWKAGLATLLVIGVAFPLAGVTIVLALLLDWLLVSRISKLKVAFS